MQTPEDMYIGDGVCTGKKALNTIEKRVNTPYVVAWNKIYRREIFQTMRYPKGRVNEDGFVFGELFSTVKILALVKEPLYYYRQREGSIMRSQYTVRNLDSMWGFVSCYEYFEAHGERDLLASTERKIFAKLTDVYYALPPEERKSEEVKRAKKKQLEIAKTLYRDKRLSKRALFRTVLFQLSPGLYGGWKKMNEMKLKKLRGGVRYPEISLIVPIYKVEKYLKECVDSILNQTFTDFELILVDDGSPDRCPQMCDEYAKQDSRIRVIHQKNGGVSSARNVGLSAAQGEWIGFVDPDDYVSPIFYETLIKAAQDADADCAMCSAENITEDGKPLGKIEPSVLDEVTTGRQVLKNIGKNMVLWNKVYKRKCWENLHFPEDKINEDAYIFAELFVQVNKVASISKRLYYYRVRPRSIMTTKKKLHNLNETAAFVYCFEYFETHGMLELLAPTEKQIFGKLTNVYYALPKDAQRSEEAKAAKKMQRDAVKKLWQYHLLSGRTLFRTVLFQLFPDIYGLRKQAYRLNVEKISEGV